MHIGLPTLIIGLALLGVTLAKFWRGIEGDARRWYGMALLGVLLSLTGLIFTLRGLKEPVPKPAIPVVEKIPEPTIEPPTELEPVPKPPTPTSPPPTENMTATMKKKRKVREAQLREDPDGESYTEEDFEYFGNQIERIWKGYDLMVEEVIMGTPAPSRAQLPKTTLLNNFAGNLDIWVANLRGRAARKKGPGTAEIKKRIFSICNSLIKMGRVYHNAVVWDKDIDYQYISDLREKVERLYDEIEEIKEKSGQ